MMKYFSFYLSLTTTLIAATTDINSDITLSGDYSNNGFSGITSSTSNGGTPWNVTVNSDLKSNSNSSYHGIYINTAGKVKFDLHNGNIETSSNGQIGMYSFAGELSILFNGKEEIHANGNVKGIAASSGGKINFVGLGERGLIEANNNTQDGIHASAAGGSEISISNIDLIIKNNGRYGIAAQNSGAYITIAGGNFKRKNLIIENNTISGIYAGANTSKVNISNMNIYAKNNTLFRAEDGGEIILSSSSTNFDDDSTLFDVGYNKIGSFTVSNSSINNTITTGDLGTSIVNLSNTTWKNIGKSNISEFGTNNSHIYMNTSAIDPLANDLLTITKKSFGQGTLHIVHQGDDDINREHLVVNQSSVPDMDANVIFKLDGGKIDDGALEYELFKGNKIGDDSNSYYLRSTGKLSDTSETIANIPLISTDFISHSINEFHKYIGDIRLRDPKDKGGLWIKNYINYLKVDHRIKSHMNMYSVTIGYDNTVYKDKENDVLLGAMIGYLYTDNIKINGESQEGKGDAKAPNIGLYLYWENIDGWFTNSIIGNYYNKFSMTNYSSSKKDISYDVNRNFMVASLDIGKKNIFELNNGSDFIVKPSIIITNIFANAKEFKTNRDKDVKFSQTNSFQARVGSKFSYNTNLGNKGSIEPFIDLAISKEFDGYTDVTYNGYEFQGGVRSTKKEIGIGIIGRFNNYLNGYIDVSYETSRNIDSISGSMGLRYSF